MEQYVGSLLERYRRAGVLIDTNLLLLYIVGAYDPQQIARFKRTADRFAPEDFDTLARVLRQFDAVVTTPHILTEVSNLMGQLTGHVKDYCFELFAQSIALMREQHAPAAGLSVRPIFVQFGIADTAILDAAYGSYLVLTDDFPLSAYLGSQGVDVLNFNNIRPLGYQ